MSSIETINNNGELTSTSNSKDSGEFVKVNSSMVDLNEERDNNFSLNNSHNSEELIREYHIIKNANQQINKTNAKASLYSGPPNKNIKIASCLDKWYKELKGNVLVSQSYFDIGLIC